ncbi:MAG TPA: amidohydrolase family protein [Gaiellaceae bacterium]|nr:amidohydrolase family protein [Gaiellaceae bacterium]
MVPERLVDVHVHHLPGVLVDAYDLRRERPLLVREGDERLVDMGGGIVFPLFPELLDPELRLQAMDEHGISASVLSAPPPGVDRFAPAEAVAVARACNDELADLAAGADGRLAALALLPLQAPDAAADELRRAVGRGLRGGVLFTNADGARPDDPGFEPLFAVAVELAVPLVLHPTTPAGVEAAAGYALPTTLGFVVETAVCALRLVLGGLLDRHPELVLVVPHVGAVIPFLLGRIDYEAGLIPGGRGALDRPPSEHLRSLHVDSVCAWPPALELALRVFGSERVLFGSDAPFWRVEDGLATVAALELPGDATVQVAHRNADRLFGLSAVG